MLHTLPIIFCFLSKHNIIWTKLQHLCAPSPRSHHPTCEARPTPLAGVVQVNEARPRSGEEMFREQGLQGDEITSEKHKAWVVSELSWWQKVHLLHSLQAGQCWGCSWGMEQWKGWQARNGQCQSWYRVAVMARMLWARTRTERQDEEHQQPTVRVRDRVMPTIIQGPLEVAVREPSKKPNPLESHHHCCWMHPPFLKY